MTVVNVDSSINKDSNAQFKPCRTDCCCPKFLQFNFLLCDVYIENDNAECD